MVATCGTNHLHVCVLANRSLSPQGCRLVLAAFCLLSLIIAFAFALAGAWPVLPFTGLELLLLVLVFRHHARRGDDYESLTIHAHRLVVDMRNGNRRIQREFNKHWTQVGLRCGLGGHGCRLTLRSHGQETEFGRLLSDEERTRLASLLTRDAGLNPL